MGILTGFIDGLKKSFSGEKYTSELGICDVCNKLAFCIDRCLYCSTKDVYTE